MKIQYKMSDDGKGFLDCDAKKIELLTAVNDFVNLVSKVINEPPDKILYRAWLAEKSSKLNKGSGDSKKERS